MGACSEEDRRRRAEAREERKKQHRAELCARAEQMKQQRDAQRERRQAR